MDSRTKIAKTPSPETAAPAPKSLFGQSAFGPQEVEEPEVGPMASRPFAFPTAPPIEPPPSLSARYDGASRFGHNFGNIAVTSPGPAYPETPVGIQAKLAVGKPGDRYEVEADAMADKVMAMPDPASTESLPGGKESEKQIQRNPIAGAIAQHIQRQSILSPQALAGHQYNQEPGLVQRAPIHPFFTAENQQTPQTLQLKHQVLQPVPLATDAPQETEATLVNRYSEEEESEVSLQRQEEATPVQGDVEAESLELQQLDASSLVQRAPVAGAKNTGGDIEGQLNNSKGGGSALDPEVRDFMEPRFGNDFSDVRIHTGSDAVQMNKDLHAQAFAHGKDIYFNQGKYNPQSDDGKRLLAHELTHVIQQTGAVQPKSVTQWVKKENKIQAKGLSAVSSEAQPEIQLKGNPQQQTGKNNQAQPAKPAQAAATATESGQGGAKHQASAAKGGTTAATPQGQGNGGTAEKQNVNKPAASGSASGSSAGGGGAKSPASPEQDPAFQAVVNKANGVAEDEKKHDPAQAESKEAQDAAEPPANEVESKAQDKQVGEMNQQQPGEFNAEAFKAALMEKIAAVIPNNEEDAKKFKDSNELDSVRQDVSSQVTEEQKQAADPIEEKTKAAPDTSGVEPKPVTPMKPPEAGAAPTDINAEKATPKPKPDSEVSAPLEANSQELDAELAKAKVPEETLEKKSNEPQFVEAVGAKKEAQAHAKEAPQAYRQDEKATINQAQAEAQTTSQTQLQGMHGQREQLLSQVMGAQSETQGKDTQERTKIANEINGIYEETKKEVETVLSDIDGEVTKKFDAGAASAKQIFENHVAREMDAWEQQRYGEWYDVTGWDDRVSDAWNGLPPEVNKFFVDGRQMYLDSMDGTLTDIANFVAQKLNDAKQKIAEGKQKIQKHVAGLPENLKKVGQEAAQNIQGKFDQLEESVNNKQDELIDSLAQKYSENLQQLDAEIEKKKEENKGLKDKAKDAIVGTVQTIMQLKDMLMGVLAKAAGAIDKIITDPIGFLGNLISGIKQGFDKFAGNIEKHLQKGLMGWLTGALAGAGITMPESFDLKGIFSLVMQVLGVVYEGIKSRVIKALGKNGEKMFAALESSFEMFVILKNEGIAGLWQFLQDKIGDLKVMVIDTIKTFVIENVIKAGVLWVVSLLNPASAFVKACKAIYDIIMFFIERGSQIAQLVNAVTDSVGAIANGAVGGAASLIENALGTSLPVVISFMASLLGLGGISEKIEGIIHKVRAPIDKAIGWIVGKATKYGKTLDNKLKTNKLGKKVESAKKSAIKKKEAVEKWTNKKKEAAQKHFEEKKQAIEKTLEQKKNKFANTKLGKKLVAADDWANKKLASLDEKREAFNNKLVAIKELPSKKLAVLEEKAEALKGAAKNKFKNSKIGQKINNKWESTKDWAGKKKDALKDKFKKNKSDSETNGKPDDRQMEQKKADLKNALAEADVLLKDDKLTASDVSKRLPKIKSKYKMTDLALIVDRKDGIKETVHVKGKINPEDETDKREKDDDLDNKSPQELMKAAGNNWKEVKKKYLSQEKVMKRLVGYRTQEVAAIIAAVKQELGDKKFKEVAAGSTDLTSDYDVTFDAGEHREVEIQAVKKFNQLFRQKWGMESGTVFDTNVYTTGHMPAGVGDLAIGELKALEEQLKNAPQGKKRQLISEIAKKKREIKSNARQLQKDAQSQTKEQLAKGSEKTSVEIMDVMSLVKIRRFMSDSEWKVYQQDTLNRFDDNKEKAAKEETSSRLKKADILYKQAKMKLDSTILDLAQQVETIDKSIQKVKGIQERSQSYHQQVDEIKKRNPDAEMEANNRLYEQHLDKVEKTLNQIKQLKEEGETTPEAKQKLDRLTLKLQYMRSMALIYANEAYHTGGAVEDVVLNQQLNLQLPLATTRYMESINEQTGFIVEQTGHGDYPGMGLWKSAKYVERLCNAANKIKLEAYAPPSSTATLLSMAQELQNIKKAKGDYKDAKTDEQKSAAALLVAQKYGYGSESNLREAVLKLNQEVNKQVRSLMISKYAKPKK